MDYDTARQHLIAAQSGIAQALSMLAVAQSAEVAATPAAAAPSTTGYVPAVDNPPTDARDSDAWFQFLSNTTIAAVAAVPNSPGYFIAYAQHMGVPVGQLGFMMQNAGVYPPFLTHAQLLAALIQAIPHDRNVGACWDSARKLWVDAAGVPYQATTVADPAWQTVFSRMAGKG